MRDPPAKFTNGRGSQHSRAAADRFVKRAVGVEPTLDGFADRRLAAWLRAQG